MAISKKQYIKGGLVFNRDPNDRQVLARKAVGSTRYGDLPIFRRRDDIVIADLAIEDEGMMLHLAKNASGVGGGDGFYYFDGAFFRKFGFGEGSLVTCTAGAAILTAAQRNLMNGMTLLPITAAGPVTVGTATTAPILPDGFPGQEITIYNAGAQTITLTDVGGMALSNLKLINATLALATLRGVRFAFYSGATAGQRWRQIGPVTDVLS